MCTRRRVTRSIAIVGATQAGRRYRGLEAADPATCTGRAVGVDHHVADLAGREAVAHHDAFIPRQAEPAQTVDDVGFEAAVAALVVGVIETNDEGAARVAGVKPVEQSGARSTDVEEPRGAGSKPDPNFHA